MRILVVGNGAREHALLWKMKQDEPAAELFITRGNGGTAALATGIPLDPADAAALAGWAQARSIDLTIVGPETPLAEGMVDHFLRAGLPIFGPTRAAATIESSKAFAKALLKEASVPTAEFQTFTDPAAAERYVLERGAPIVVKASGLAAGKGAVVCGTVAEAVAAVQQMMSGSMGEAGREVVIEEFMEGEELSVLALTDGERALPLVPAQDHKRIGEGDTGPNTGGMGAYAPVSLATAELLARVQREIFTPTLAAMRAHNRPFCGMLYAGLMLTKSGPKVVEFNARFGDPETQVVLPLLQDSLLTPMLAIARGESIAGMTVKARPGAALTTVLAAAGYPGTPEKGKTITIPESVAQADNVVIFHAGTKTEDGSVVTAGGRVLALTGLGDTLAEAASRSRAAAEAIEFEGKQYRRDIGWRELNRLAERVGAHA
jgi:phosphoribosylamine---glycine ligase